eukprot:UN12829
MVLTWGVHNINISISRYQIALGFSNCFETGCFRRVHLKALWLICSKKKIIFV